MTHTGFQVGLLFLFMFFSGLTQAQYNAQRIIGGNSFDYGVDLTQTPDSGFILLGSSGSYSQSSDILLWSIDKNLTYRWHRNVGFSESDKAIRFIRDSQDSMLVLASSLQSGGNYDTWIFRVSLDGQLGSSKLYDHSSWEFPSAISKCSDGGYVICGTTFGSDGKDGFVMKLDSSWNESWFDTYPRSGQDTLSSIIEINSRFYVVGTSDGVNSDGMNIRVMKIDASGNLLFDSFFGGSEDDMGVDIARAPSGNSVYFGGQTRSYGNIRGYYNTFLHCIDTNAAYVWPAPKYSQETVDYYMCNIAVANRDAGWGNATLYSFFEKRTWNSDFQVFRNNPWGNFLLSSSYGTFGNEKPSRGILTFEGGIAMLGTTWNYAPGLENFYFLRTDTLLVNSLAPQIQVSIAEENTPTDLAFLYPTMNNGRFLVHGLKGGEALSVRNCLGQSVVFDANWNESSKLWEVLLPSGFEKGMYFFTASDPELLKNLSLKFFLEQ